MVETNRKQDLTLPVDTTTMPPTFDSILQIILGPMLMGFCLHIFLFGITTVQTYLYYLAFPGDHPLLQSLVYGVYLVGTAQTGMVIHDFFLLYSTRYGYLKPNLSPDQARSWNSGLHFTITIPICGSLVGCAVQLFYAHRIRLLTRSVFVPGLLAVLAALQWAGAIMVAAGTYSPQLNNEKGPSNLPKNMRQKMNNIGYVGNILWGSTSTACDILIAIYMISLLLRAKPMARQCQNRIFKLIRLILETGSLTAAASITFVVTILFAPGGVFMIPGLAIGKVYAISLLVLLNNRFLIVGGRQQDESSFLLPNEMVEIDTVLSSVSGTTMPSTTIR